jgi:hypothetical protein
MQIKSLMASWGLDIDESLVRLVARRLPNVSVTTGGEGPAARAVAYNPNSAEWNRIFRGQMKTEFTDDISFHYLIVSRISLLKNGLLT